MSLPRGNVVVVTGLSGAGKSTALHALEDLGYFCVDNLPTSVVEATLRACEEGGMRRVALGIDVRVGSFLDAATDALEHIRTMAWELLVLFVDASDAVLARRYSETRRPHPLTSARQRGPIGVLEGIEVERARLAPLRAESTLVLDTSEASVHELRRRVIELVGSASGEAPTMVTRFLSFGFKYGVPIDADVVLDVRFLDNPHFVPELRPKTGADPEIIAYLEQSPRTHAFLAHAEGLLSFCLPNYREEGKSYLTVAVGCTGGRHRSVFIARTLAARVTEKTGMAIAVVHRDVERAGPSTIARAGTGANRG